MAESKPRYLYRLGIIVTDDVIQKAANREQLPWTGALVVRLMKPVPCVFISYGLGGVVLPSTSGLCPIGDTWNIATREERYATSAMMGVLDDDGLIMLRMRWFLIDLVETQGRIIKNPTDDEISELYTFYKSAKDKDKAKYKLASRIARRRTTAGLHNPDGHEDDSEKDPMCRFFDDMEEREARADKAKKRRLGDYPDTEWGRRMSTIKRRCRGSESGDGVRKKRATGVRGRPPQCQDIPPIEQLSVPPHCDPMDHSKEAIRAPTTLVGDPADDFGDLFGSSPPDA
jgi:hypothetical protein